MLFIHAINPWGMHWARRCDHEGIDLNRNFIDFSRLPAEEPDYQKVLGCLQISNIDERRAAFSELRCAWGESHYDKIFSGGQYGHAWAPFYGGRAPSFSRGVIDDIVQQYALEKRELVVVDIHSGLGPWGYGQLISDHAAKDRCNHYAKKLFGPWVAITESGESFSVPKQGLLDYRWHQLMPEGNGCFLTLELGTHSKENLFSVLLDEHLYWKDHQPSEAADKMYVYHREAMLNHFFPNSQQWQQSVLFQAWQVFTRLLDVYR